MRRLAAFAAALLVSCSAFAQEGAQTILHLLDYVGADYGGAVEDGKVKSADEYAEMVGFTTQANDALKALPDNPAKASVVAEGAHLVKLVSDKASPETVATTAANLRWAIIVAYKLQVAPRAAPDFAKGAGLYATNCASCHGAQGKGDGSAAKGLTPAPANFHDSAQEGGGRSVRR